MVHKSYQSILCTVRKIVHKWYLYHDSTILSLSRRLLLRLVGNCSLESLSRCLYYSLLGPRPTKACPILSLWVNALSRPHMDWFPPFLLSFFFGITIALSIPRPFKAPRGNWIEAKCLQKSAMLGQGFVDKFLSLWYSCWGEMPQDRFIQWIGNSIAPKWSHHSDWYISSWILQSFDEKSSDLKWQMVVVHGEIPEEDIGGESIFKNEWYSYYYSQAKSSRYPKCPSGQNHNSTRCVSTPLLGYVHSFESSRDAECQKG